MDPNREGASVGPPTPSEIVGPQDSPDTILTPENLVSTIPKFSHTAKIRFYALIRAFFDAPDK